MKTTYAANKGPGVSRRPFASSITHSHYQTIDYQSFYPFPYFDNAKINLQQIIDQETTRVTNCIGFFKSYAKNAKHIGAELRAAVDGAITEDENRLKELQAHRPR